MSLANNENAGAGTMSDPDALPDDTATGNQPDAKPAMRSSQYTGEITELLEALDCAPTELHSLCYALPGQKMQTKIITADKLSGLAAAKAATGHDVWFGINAVRPEIVKGRGTAADVVSVKAVAADVDLHTASKPGGCADVETANKIMVRIAEIVGQNPVGVVNSGHGFHAYWAIENGDIGPDFTNADARALSKRFGDLVARVAAEYDTDLDNISDLPRILRVPGTTNYKFDPVPCTLIPLNHPGAPLSVAELSDRLDECLPADPTPETAATATSAGGTAEPGAGDPRLEKIASDTLAKLSACPDGGFCPRYPAQKKAGRNWGTYYVGIDLAGFRGLDRENVLRPGIIEACAANGYLADEGIDAVNNTIDSAFAYADTQPPKLLSEPIGPAAQIDALDNVAPQQNTTLARPRVWRATDLRPAEQPRFLVPLRIPRAAVTVFIGEEGIGKSLFVIHLISVLTTGRGASDMDLVAGGPQDVMLVATEDDWTQAVRPRLEVAGADLEHVHVICTDDDGAGSPVFPRDMDILRATDVPYAAVIVDTWVDTLSPNIQVKDPQQARQALHPWKELATTTDAAVVLVTHTNRLSTGSARDRYGVTSELRKKARMTLYAMRDEETDHLVIGPEKSNAAEVVNAWAYRLESVQHFTPTPDHDGRVPRLVSVGSTNHTIRELVAENFETETGGADRVDREAAVRWLQEYLQIHAPSVGSADVKKDAFKAGISERTLHRARQELGVRIGYEGSPPVTKWGLPANAAAEFDTSHEGEG